MRYRHALQYTENTARSGKNFLFVFILLTNTAVEVMRYVRKIVVRNLN